MHKLRQFVDFFIWTLSHNRNPPGFFRDLLSNRMNSKDWAFVGISDGILLITSIGRAVVPKAWLRDYKKSRCLADRLWKVSNTPTLSVTKAEMKEINMRDDFMHFQKLLFSHIL